jgi:excinuclease ABC subunit C
MVVFEKGIPNKKHYRKFNIRSVVGPDDFASMEEVLLRRFKHWESSRIEGEDSAKKDPSFMRLPDLLIVDGGKGQLSRAVDVLNHYNLIGKVKVVGLAKRMEELFLPDRSDSIILPSNSQGLYLLQRIRDEAHRFAITAHRNKRTQKGLFSTLENIPGIGPARRKALFKQFGSIERIRKATLEELTNIAGITVQIAEKIKEELG